MKIVQLLGITIIPITLLGVVSNGLIVFAILKNRSLSHSFSLLTGSQAAFNGLFSFFFLIFVSPTVILDSKFLKQNSHHFGPLLLFFYDVSIQTHVLITINRFCAAFLPLVYKNAFSLRYTKLIICISVSTSIIILIVFFQILPCHFYYDDRYFGFAYTDIPVCNKYSIYCDMGKLTVMCIFNVVVDSITLWKVRRVRSSRGMTSFQKKEIDFLKQSFGQAIYMMICIPLCYLVPMYTTNEIPMFLMCTLWWPSIHAFEGAFTFYFNMEIRRSLLKQFKKSNASTNVSKITAM